METFSRKKESHHSDRMVTSITDLRDDERGEQLTAKIEYIRRNPVVAGLCARPEDWRWIYPK
jgi:hypothetical protein